MEQRGKVTEVDLFVKLDLLFAITLAISLQGFVDTQKRTLYVPLYSSLTEKEIHTGEDCCW